MILRLLAIPVIALLAFIALGGALTALAGVPPLRGQMVDLGGGRHMHIICEGPKGAGPTIVFEAGAFGFSADWGAVQQKATARGWRSCAYDRAGMGFSDRSDRPSTALNVADDLHRLLAATGETGPFILVGHSMAGVFLPVFAKQYPRDTAGLVLVDASTRQAAISGSTDQFITQFTKASRWAAIGASTGLFKTVEVKYGDRIGLPPAASREKRWAFANGGHMRMAYEEVKTWPVSNRQVIDAGPLPARLPVSVVTAGPAAPGRDGRKEQQAAPARMSEHGYYANVPEADHRSLLGMAHGEAVIEGIAKVRESL